MSSVIIPPCLLDALLDLPASNDADARRLLTWITPHDALSFSCRCGHLVATTPQAAIEHARQHVGHAPSSRRDRRVLRHVEAAAQHYAGLRRTLRGDA